MIFCKLKNLCFILKNMNFYLFFFAFQLIKTQYPNNNECKYVSGICKEVQQDNSILLPKIPIKYTKFYEANKNKNRKIFFDDRTFGIDIYPNPCEKITYNSKFRKFINENIKCQGELCINGKFACSKDKSRKCYHVEHIIDIKGPEYGRSNKNKNIAANFVMSDSSWNSGLGGLASNWYGNSANEKLVVYGQEIMQRVRNKIKECQGKKGKRDDYNDTDTCEQDCICDYDADSDCGCDCEEIEEDFSCPLINSSFANCSINSTITECKIPEIFPLIAIGLFMIGTLFGCFIYFIYFVYAKYNKNESEDLQEYEIKNI
jgi:hypothetical protein